MAELLEEGASLLETGKIQKAMKKKKIQFHRSRPTATTRLNPALILDHNHLLKGTETERISQEAAGVIGNMTSSEVIKGEKVIEVAIEEGK